MQEHDPDELAITEETTLREAMVRLDQTGEKCLFVLDDTRRVLGSLTDGDVRRAILSGAGLEQRVASAYNPDPVLLLKPNDGHRSSLREGALRLMKERMVEVIPVVDDGGTLVECLTWTDLFGEKRVVGGALQVPVVIMAGGLGSRLEPFTKVLPKPLIPVNEKPIIEHIIDKFVDVGTTEFWLTVNYKSRIMKAYFQDRDPDYEVHFVDEPEPLGTAGSLQYVRGRFEEPFFVTNCDIIIDADYRKVLDFHLAQGHAVTLVGSAVHYQIPYGTCVLNPDGSLSRIDEKPRYDFLVNTGMYVVSPKALDLIPASGVYHMTHLIGDVIDRDMTVGVFPISQDAWIDVGQWKEYKRASELL